MSERNRASNGARSPWSELARGGGPPRLTNDISLTGAEIADRTGLTAASVRVNLHRGMKLLREKLT